MLSRYSPNLFLVGNFPLGVLYASTAKQGLPLALRIAIMVALIAILAWVVFARKTENPLADVLVLVGSILIWGSVLFVYGHISEAGNGAVYDLAELALFGGIGIMLLGVFVGYLAQRKSVRGQS